jgi:hypothetical protein
MCLLANYRKKSGTKFSLHPQESDPELYPDPDALVRCTDPSSGSAQKCHGSPTLLDSPEELELALPEEQQQERRRS